MREQGRGATRAALRLVVVGGWIASGKSTVARAVAEAIGAERLVGDELRTELAAGGARRAYLPDFSETLYAELLARAEASLAAGRSVVLDASFPTRAWRAAARALAARRGAAFLFVECRAAPALCRQRLAARGNAHEARAWLALFDRFLAQEWEPADELPEAERLLLDTGRRADDTFAELRTRLA